MLFRSRIGCEQKSGGFDGLGKAAMRKGKAWTSEELQRNGRATMGKGKVTRRKANNSEGIDERREA